jgi:hypothetical protein
MLSEAHLPSKIPTVQQIKGFKRFITLEYFGKSSLIKSNCKNNPEIIILKL